MESDPSFWQVAIAFPFLWCLVAGFVATLYNVFASFGLRLRWQRERRANTLYDDLVLNIIGQLQDPKDRRLWATSQETFGEKIVCVRAGTTISYYAEWQSMEIAIDGVGKFKSIDLKPSIARDLSRTCEAFKRQMAVHTILNPDTVEVTQHGSHLTICAYREAA